MEAFGYGKWASVRRGRVGLSSNRDKREREREKRMIGGNKNIHIIIIFNIYKSVFI